MKIAICDDNKLELGQVESIEQDFISDKQPLHSISIHTFSNGNDLFLFTQKFGAFDVVILDIIMPGLNGIDLAAKLRAHNDNCRIIFLTSSPEFAVDSYKVKAYYYLLKNSAATELHALLNRVLDEITEENTSSVVIKEKGKWTRVSFGSIKYVESINHTVQFHLHKKESILSFGSLNEYHELLLSDKRFVKCHKSYIVNMQHVASITSRDFVLGEDVSVPISRKIYPQIKDAYLDYFFTEMK
jgi:DNA-binding LytR/AlgR family response regulator